MKNKKESKKQEKYPEGHFVGMWMAIGIAIFSGIGIPLTIATENPGLIGIGPALGVLIGLAVGQSIENKYKKQGKIRSLNKEERKNKKIAVFIGILLLLLGLGTFLTLYLLR